MRLLVLFPIEEVFDVIQHGQVFKPKTKGLDGQCRERLFGDAETVSAGSGAGSV